MMVYYQDDYPKNENRFPDFYDGKLFTYDWMRGWIMAVTMDEEGNFERMEPFLPSFEFNHDTTVSDFRGNNFCCIHSFCSQRRC